MRGRGGVRRVAVIGLDCASPGFVFDQAGWNLPHLRELMLRGTWGRLRSCDPPITIPAWTCVTTGRDPGELGVYGFRNRRSREDYELTLTSSREVRAPRIWDLLADEGKRSIVLGVPHTYPPQPVAGCLVTGLLTPGEAAEWTYPGALKQEILSNVGGYQVDAEGFRTVEREAVRSRVFSLMHNRFDLAEYLVKTREWDFFMMVEIGMDRLHHAFWHYADPAHPQYEAGSKFSDTVRRFYEETDERIGRLRAILGEDTTILAVSDHGARPLRGGFRINQWLINEGYLRLRSPVSTETAFGSELVDWPGTVAWGTGGYYARIFINVRGRDGAGSIEEADFERVRREIRAKLEQIPAPDGGPMGNRALIPEAVYAKVEGVAPDLMVYFGGLDWRALGGVGYSSCFAEANDEGPDDINHDFEGVWILDDGPGRGGGEVRGATILDIAPTILSLYGLDSPADFAGRPLI